MDTTRHPARTLDYFLLDVFTDTPFSGNQLAVFVDPSPLTDEQMQRIALELALSETVFIWSPSQVGGPWPTRIFTPAMEVPFAGHPTIGAAILLVSLGLVTGDGSVTLELEEAVGRVRVDVELHEDGTPRTADLVVPRFPELVDTADPAELIAVVGLEPSDLHPDLPVRGYSAGNPFSIIPVVDSAALARARIDTSRWSRSVAASSAPHLYLVTPLTEPGASARRWRVRMFSPAMGIAEDPATGSAAAAFAGYILEIGGGEDEHSILIEQGIEMRRPSILRLTVSAPSDEQPEARVGGPAVVIGNGTLAIPPLGSAK